MSAKYEIKEVRVTLKTGVEVYAQVDSVEAIKQFLQDLAKSDLNILDGARGGTSRDGKPLNLNLGSPPSDTPISRVEIKASLNAGILIAKKVIAFKENVPQLLRPSLFSNVTEAVLALIFALEAGLQKSSIDYEAFKSLFEAQNIKSGSPLSTLLTNLRNAGYLDRTKFGADRSISLTGKGETKAIEVLRGLCK
jgi:hypothetical protein